MFFSLYILYVVRLAWQAMAPRPLAVTLASQLEPLKPMDEWAQI